MIGGLHNRIVVFDFFSKLVETLPQKISSVNIPILPNGGKPSNEKSGTCNKAWEKHSQTENENGNFSH